MQRVSWNARSIVVFPNKFKKGGPFHEIIYRIRC